MLTARLATVDSMTHDVIRDLLGVKLDLTNYAVSEFKRWEVRWTFLSTFLVLIIKDYYLLGNPRT